MISDSIVRVYGKKQRGRSQNDLAAAAGRLRRYRSEQAKPKAVPRRPYSESWLLTKFEESATPDVFQYVAFADFKRRRLTDSRKWRS
jgi:hypothetical protein